jgi:hypothetical protein
MVAFHNRRKPMRTRDEAAIEAGDELASEAGGLSEYIPLRRIAAELPRRRAGKRTHVATLYRWREHGLHGIKLRTIQIGSTACTTRAWLAEFFDALTRKATGAPPGPGQRSPAARDRGSRKADEQLRRLGV